MDNKHVRRFSIGTPVALDGGDGEAIATAGDLIATLGASQATWWRDGARHTAELPGIRVHGARFSADRRALLAGSGSIDLATGAFTAHPAFSGLVRRGPPGGGAPAIQVTSWSADRRHAAALIGWSGGQPARGDAAPSQVAVLDLAGGGAPVRIAADAATDVRVVGDRVVVGAATVRIYSFTGAELAALPATPGPPTTIAGGDGGPVFLIDADWSIRVVDPASWKLRATWAGASFVDVVAVPGGLIALDLEGTLHGGCIEGDRVVELGRAVSGVRAALLAVTSDGRLAMTGSGPVPVHTVSFEFDCG